MIIQKKPADSTNYYINAYQFSRARDAFFYLLKNFYRDHMVLLPSYIGYSINEGSGIFDPIKEASLKYDFYQMDSSLNIDLNSIIDKTKNKHHKIVLLIVHYFGFYDKNLAKIKKIAKDNSIPIVEDYAHAFFSFFANPTSNFNHCFFSLHKMLPYNDGGLLVTKESITTLKNNNHAFKKQYWNYNYTNIIKSRIENFKYLYKKLSNNPKIEILRDSNYKGIPQTFPILLKSAEIRDKLYFKMNEKGFGVVSLYHTLINEIIQKEKIFQPSVSVSQRILNLPLHQDVNKNQIDLMINCLEDLL